MGAPKSLSEPRFETLLNRVFRDKPGVLVVDYLRLADQLKNALIPYTESGGNNI